MPGPAPKPTAVKRLTGNPGKRALNDREPEPGGRATCPRWLSDEARREWRRLAGELQRLGLLTTVDRSAMAAYCAAYARWVEAERALKTGGMVVMTSNGNEIQSPWLSIANKAIEQMVKLAAEFGMTPAARTRIKAQPKDETSLADLLFGGGDE